MCCARGLRGGFGRACSRVPERPEKQTNIFRSTAFLRASASSTLSATGRNCIDSCIFSRTVYGSTYSTVICINIQNGCKYIDACAQTEVTGGIGRSVQYRKSRDCTRVRKTFCLCEKDVSPVSLHPSQIPPPVPALASCHEFCLPRPRSCFLSPSPAAIGTAFWNSLRRCPLALIHPYGSPSLCT